MRAFTRILVVFGAGSCAWLLATVTWVDAAKAQESIAPVSLSDRMSWDQIGRALEAFPPSFDHGDSRLLIMQSLDRLVDIQVQYMKPEDRPRFQEIVDFYRGRVDRGLEALEKVQVKEGVGAFKFYSSSLVLKSAQGTVAIDFCQGPVHNAGEPESCDLYRTGFYLTPEQRDRLARLVDVQLVTHRHHDHADYSLAKRLIQQGRRVVGPAQLKTHWPQLAGGITVPTYDTIETFGPCQVLTQLGYQYATSMPGPDGKRQGVPDPTDPGRDSESVRYLIRIGGITFLQSAENQVEADRWLAKAADRGWNVDVLLSPGQYQGGESVVGFLQGKDYFRLPLHEYEMEHEGGGNRTGHYLDGASRKAFDAKRLMPLLWGEHFVITSASIPRADAAVSAHPWFFEQATGAGEARGDRHIKKDGAGQSAFLN